MAQLTRADDDEQLAAAAALRLTTLIEEATSARQRATICLAGGHTPERLYERLADDSEPWRHRIDWRRLHVFWGDERHVPPDHPDSNFGMADRTLLSRVPIVPEHVHRIHGERPDPNEAAREYESELHNQRHGSFDVVLLGVGEDAHIASIFPGSPLLKGWEARTDTVAAVRAPRLDAWRITLTPRALLDSRAILVMASGARKADAVRAALVGPDDVSSYPAQLVRGAEWLIDRAAARRLDAQPAQ